MWTTWEVKAAPTHNLCRMKSLFRGRSWVTVDCSRVKYHHYVMTHQIKIQWSFRTLPVSVIKVAFVCRTTIASLQSLEIHLFGISFEQLVSQSVHHLPNKIWSSRCAGKSLILFIQLRKIAAFRAFTHFCDGLEQLNIKTRPWPISFGFRQKAKR